MKILFLGTGAADWVIADKSKEKYYRRLSSAVIDSVLLIDPGPDVLDAINEFDVDMNKIKYVINTHKHSDHYNKDTLNALIENGAEFIDFAAVTVSETKKVGRYTITVVPANHSCPTNHFIINDGKKKLFYALDGAWLVYDEVQEIIKQAPIDLAVLDATIGFVDGDYRVFEHNNLNMVLEMKSSLSKHINNCCISHLAYTLHTDHETVSETMKKQNVITAYDGFELEV